jgi:methionine-S-sulfoxide reductase
MKKITPLHYLIISAFLSFLVLFFIVTKNNLQSNEIDSFKDINIQFENLETRPDLSQATFSGGCFWCMEGPFEALDGVEEVISGYTGGLVENPNYEEVISGSTGHREAVRIYYNPSNVTFDELLNIYWTQIDPTDSGGQFADRGEQYTTAVFFHTDDQKEAAQNSIELLNESDKYEKEIVTEVVPVSSFYPAEDYHQDFYKKSEERYKSYSKGSGRVDYIEKIKNKLK